MLRARHLAGRDHEPGVGARSPTRRWASRSRWTPPRRRAPARPGRRRWRRPARPAGPSSSLSNWEVNSCTLASSLSGTATSLTVPPAAVTVMVSTSSKSTAPVESSVVPVSTPPRAAGRADRGARIGARIVAGRVVSTGAEHGDEQEGGQDGSEKAAHEPWDGSAPAGFRQAARVPAQNRLRPGPSSSPSATPRSPTCCRSSGAEAALRRDQPRALDRGRPRRTSRTRPTASTRRCSRPGSSSGRSTRPPG